MLQLSRDRLPLRLTALHCWPPRRRRAGLGLRPDARAFLDGTRRFAQQITPDPGGSALTSGLGGRPLQARRLHVSSHMGPYTHYPLYALSARPQQGTLLLGGFDMQQIAEDALRAHIGYLPQDYRLVQGTLRDNLLLGLSQVDDDVLMTCAERTGLAPFIAAHPKGLDMPISEGGGGVSGG